MVDLTRICSRLRAYIALSGIGGPGAVWGVDLFERVVFLSELSSAYLGEEELSRMVRAVVGEAATADDVAAIVRGPIC